MLLDIALVTEALVNLLTFHVGASPEAGKVSPLTVTGQSPDKLQGDHTIGFYLYHITEDAQYQNVPAVSGDDPPVRYTPMGLTLHYQLSGHSDTVGPNAVETEQTMVGLAMKALHDYPVIDDTTVVAGKIVFPTSLRGAGNRLRITMQPVSASDSTHYWTAGAQPLRLAIYYQVSVVLIEPEPIQTRPGRVLKYGVFTFVRGAPHLDGSRSNIMFTIPGEATPRTVEVQPAQAPLGGQLVFYGTDLSGDQTTLLLKSSLFTDAIEVGVDWGVVATESAILATVQSLIGTITTVPGVYSASAKVIERRLMPDNSLRDFPKTSNDAPFLVTPLIQSIAPPDGSLVVVVTGGVFQDAAGISADAVDVFVGPQKLPLKAGAALNAGEYDLPDASTVRFRYPIAGLTTGSVVPFRLIINGAESTPIWVTVP
jgi:hypothetical protein